MRLSLLCSLLAMVGPHARSADTEPPEARRSIPPADRWLDTLRPVHPRLFASAADFARLRIQVTNDTVRRGWWGRVRAEADRTLQEPPVGYAVGQRGRLANVGRRVVERAYVLGMAWRLTGDRRYADRLMREFEVVAAFPDWNPSAFPDTAELCHGVGLGYDWCQDAWTPTERSVVRSALVDKGLRSGMRAYQSVTGEQSWTRAGDPMNPICNAGLAIAALAIAEESRELASGILAASAVSFQKGMQTYAPDGGWADGLAYWSYATIHTVAYLAALESALGTEFGLSGMPGFRETARFPFHLTGPRDRTFNFGDTRESAVHGPHLFWLARKFDLPRAAIDQREGSNAHPLDILWFDEAVAARPAAAEPLDRYFRGAEVVTMRSAWDADPAAVFPGRRAVFVGFKAGDNRAPHAHLDQGSFVLDAGGFRWALDPGPQPVSADGSLPPAGPGRWDSYFHRAEGHNTLVLGDGSGPDQDPSAVSGVTRFVSRPAEAFAVADLTPAYARSARKVQRGVTLRNKRTEVLVQDEIETEKPTDVWWFLHTAARVSADGRKATLTFGTNLLSATLLGGGPSAAFSVTDPVGLPGSPSAGGPARSGIRRLTVHLQQVRDARFAVLLVPGKPGGEPPAAEPPADLLPLGEWK